MENESFGDGNRKMSLLYSLRYFDGTWRSIESFLGLIEAI
jgi:hypothetical protein